MKSIFAILFSVLLFNGSAFALVAGDKAPAFKLPGADGKVVNSADYAGKIVVLEWMNPGCPYIKKHYSSGHMQKLQQELSFLRGQLSPHFLLNTMNNLYGLSVIKSDKLPNLMLRLSDLLRYTIYDTKTDRVPLKNEVKYLMDYIELQKIRLSSKVRLMVDFPTEIPEKWTIVPLLLVVFVENAFKHSQTNANERAPFIHFDIAVTEGYLHFIAENSFEEQAKTPDGFTIEKEGGLGLQTTLRRIELIYGKTALPKITTNDGCHRVELKLKLTDGKD